MAIETSAADRYAQVNGLRLHYVEWGEASAPAVVLLHGLRGSARTWDLIAEPLASDYHLLALDQRGRGGSDWAPDGDYSREAYVADIDQFVRQLGIERFILIGHSMGGANTILYTAKHSERVQAAVIEDMGPSTDPPAPGGARIGRELDGTPASFTSWKAAEDFLRGLRPGTSEEAIRTAVQNSFKESADGEITWKYDLEGIRAGRRKVASQPPFDLWPSVKAIKCPALVLRGAKSDILAAETAKAMSEANPHIQWVEIAGASHFVHDDNTADYNRELQSFLRSV
jgi:pimeloyl-ACP methyl ester carboxylesterase